MLNRCYNKNYLKRRPTYQGCCVCKEWLLFSNFKAWMENQDWEGKELDKDIVGDGSIYSPETCCFVPKIVNTFLLERGTSRGVNYLDHNECYRCLIGNPYTKTNDNLGYYERKDDAILAWRVRKYLTCLKLCRDYLTEPRVIEALQCKYYVEKVEDAEAYLESIRIRKRYRVQADTYDNIKDKQNIK